METLIARIRKYRGGKREMKGGGEQEHPQWQNG